MSATNLVVGGGGTPVTDLSCKSDDPPVEPEVRVEVTAGGQWIRIPVTKCELWINKDGAADIERTAKVKFPVEWDHNRNGEAESIAQYVNGFQTETTAEPDSSSDDLYDYKPSGDVTYDECRIYFYDHDSDTYQVSHYGYIGGIGPATESGVMKFWVYDPADLMRGIHVSKGFGNPTIQQVIDFALNGVDDQGRPVGIEQRSVFDNVRTYIAGIQEVRATKRDLSDFGGLTEIDPTDFSDVGFDESTILQSDLPVVGSFQLDVSDLVSDIYGHLFGTEVTGGIFGGYKRFQLNRHNMVDLLDWFANEIGGKWHFEPTEHGPVLFFDNSSARENEEDGDFSRRIFADQEITESETTVEQNVLAYQDREIFTTIRTLNNQALFDIKPFNTIQLYGESDDPTRYTSDFMNTTSPIARTERFPWVEVKYPPLIDRAGGYEYSAPAVESDKVFLRQAEAKAKEEFRKHLEEQTEGTITIKGEPYIAPYDYIRTIPVCNDTYTNADMVPITYEINGVKHSVEAGKRYTTELGVSLTFDESLLEVESEYREA